MPTPNGGWRIEESAFHGVAALAGLAGAAGIGTRDIVTSGVAVGGDVNLEALFFERSTSIKLEGGSVGPWASFPMRRCHRR